jgi:hypothetical protein
MCLQELSNGPTTDQRFGCDSKCLNLNLYSQVLTYEFTLHLSSDRIPHLPQKKYSRHYQKGKKNSGQPNPYFEIMRMMMMMMMTVVLVVMMEMLSVVTR